MKELLLLWELRRTWGDEERAEWERLEAAGAYYCNSHRRHTRVPNECRSTRGGIMIPCNVERDFARELPE